MSNKPRFLRRTTHVAALLALSVPVVAPAVEPGFNPNTTPAVIPGTSTTTDVWKFVGTYLHVDPVSGVQVHPYWVLATKHAKPDLGATFTNGYGSSTFVWCAPDMTSGEDISLCLISPPINPPSGVDFPNLLSNGASVLSGTKENQLTGALLGTGFGQPTRGTQSAAWVTPNARSLYYHPLSNPTATTPHKGGGDSGSGLYWFAAGKTEPVLTTINYSDQDYLDGGVQFSPAVQSWISSYAGALTWTTASQYSTARRTAPVPVVEVLSTTNNSASIRLTKPTLQAGDTFSGYYLAAVVPPSTTLIYIDNVTDQSAAVPYTFTNLQTDATYKFCAFTYNGYGLQNFSGENTPEQECSSFTPRKAPAAPSNLQATLLGSPAPGINEYQLSWTAPPPVSGATVTEYRINAAGPQAYDGLRVPASQTTLNIVSSTAQGTLLFSISGMNERTQGPVSNVITVP